ncbi:protein lingerer-like [Dorcoceras hygrometricum]|uniref:Protein lingerer-like n=1 Tax=Dorcoceras hygrometricum TaxID=472368 RepID=A0A2Z7A594_9LAMI|nr:protein lingerer-like [Dorcoceras hygrometricum]
MAHRNQYVFPATNPDYTYNEVQQLSTAFSQSQTNSQRQTHTPFTNVMQSYTTPLPSTLLASNVTSSRESDLQFSPLSVAQSLSAKFGSSVSYIGGSAMSMSEALKTAGFLSMQYAPQAISGTNVAIGPPFLNTLLYIHILRQPSLSLGSFVNMIDYPFLKLSDEPTFCTIWCNYNL